MANLSANGMILAAGSIENDGTNSVKASSQASIFSYWNDEVYSFDKGHFRVFECNSATRQWDQRGQVLEGVLKRSCLVILLHSFLMGQFLRSVPA